MMNMGLSKYLLVTRPTGCHYRSHLMPNIGKVTGFKIAKNMEGDSDRLILQVETLEGEDTRSIELFNQAGEDTNPANGCRIYIIDASSRYQIGVAVSDDLTPECEPGEKEFYSTDNPVTTKLARVKLNKDSEIIMNEGSDNAVKHAALVSALNTFLIALNGQLTGLGATGGLTINLTPAKSGTVFIP